MIIYSQKAVLVEGEAWGGREGRREEGRETGGWGSSNEQISPAAETKGWEVDCSRWSSSARKPSSSRARPREGAREKDGWISSTTTESSIALPPSLPPSLLTCLLQPWHRLSLRALDTLMVRKSTTASPALPPSLPTCLLQPRRGLPLRAPDTLVVRKSTAVFRVQDAGWAGGGGGGEGGRGA